MNLRKAYRNTWLILLSGFAILFAGIILALLSGSDSRSVAILGIVIPIGLIAMIAAAVYSVFQLRCPHCSGSLRLNFARPSFCPHCGEELDW